MVQNKKNFSPSKMEEGKNQDKKNQTLKTDKGVDSSRTGSLKGQTSQARDKADVSKKDIGTRK